MLHTSSRLVFGLAVVALGLAACAANGPADAAKAGPPQNLGKPDADGSYRLTLEKLPEPVRKAFLEQAGGNPIRGISMEMHDGKPVYDCDVFINGKKLEVIADADGKLLNKPIRKPAVADAVDAKFRDTFNVDPTNWTDRGTSTYFILQPGYKLTYAAGKDTLVVTVLDETKMVDSVKTRIVEERETKDGKLAEVSRNYFAMDKSTGDIYYFGEAVDMYDADGKVTGHGGSWESGVNKARYGLFVPAKPKVGDKYYQEVAPGVAMDRVEIASITETVKVPAGEFKGCLKLAESSGMESGTGAKLYAPEVGLVKDDEFELVKKEMPPTDAAKP